MVSKKKKFTPFNGKYKMLLEDFCEKYDRDLSIVRQRINSYWEIEDALITPTTVGTMQVHQIRRALHMLDLGWSVTFIANRLSCREEDISSIEDWDPYIKSIFNEMDNFFYLDHHKIDLDKVFKEKNTIEKI